MYGIEKIKEGFVEEECYGDTTSYDFLEIVHKFLVYLAKAFYDKEDLWLILMRLKRFLVLSLLLLSAQGLEL